MKTTIALFLMCPVLCCADIVGVPSILRGPADEIAAQVSAGQIKPGALVQITGASSVTDCDEVDDGGGYYALCIYQDAGLKSILFGPISTPGPITVTSGGGGLQISPNGAARPTCAVSTRGTYWQTYGGAGVADTVAVCAKDAADAYDWRTIY